MTAQNARMLAEQLDEAQAVEAQWNEYEDGEAHMDEDEVEEQPGTGSAGP